jgi:uncharacterized protein
MAVQTQSNPVFNLDAYFKQDFYVPAFHVIINGKQLPIDNDVVSLSYSDKKNSIDHAELTISNWLPGDKGKQGSWKYSDANELIPWQEIEIWMGYYQNGRDELRRMMVGELVRMTPTFAVDSPATLSVRAMGVLHRFRSGQIHFDYKNTKDSSIFRDIVNHIAKETRQKFTNLTLTTDVNEITANLAKEKEIKFLTCKQQYAINYILKRADEINYELAIDVSQGPVGSPRAITLHFRSSKDLDFYRPVYRLDWGKTLLSFQPSLSTANQVSEVIVRSWNPHLKQKFEGRATMADLKNERIIDPTADLDIPQGPLSKKPQIITDKVVQSNDEAIELAKSELRNLAQGIVLGKGKIIGLPDLRTGVMVQINGLGSRFSGTYVVEETMHTISDGGYTTDFSCRMKNSITR